RGSISRRHQADAPRDLPAAVQRSAGLIRPEPRAAGDLGCHDRGSACSVAGRRVPLEAAVQLQLGALDLDIALEIRAGEVVALLGPNGAGKTTLLRALAGLIPVSRGHVHLDGAVLEDSATGTYVPTEKRPIGFVFQDY